MPGSFSVDGFGKSNGFSVGGFGKASGFGAEQTPLLRFTRSAATGTSPLITAAAAADADFIWTGPGGTFTGKQPDIGNFPAGDFTLRSTAWDAVTAIKFDSRLLTSFNYMRIVDRLTSITQLFINGNAGLVEDVSSWTLPPSVTDFRLIGDVLIVGDVQGIAPTATMGLINLGVCPGLYGDVSKWVANASLGFALVNGTGCSYGSSGFLAAASRDSSTYNFNDCGLAAADVDRILADCVASATESSTLTVAGTNAAPTGGAANADYVTLTTATGSGGLGWTVTIS